MSFPECENNINFSRFCVTVFLKICINFTSIGSKTFEMKTYRTIFLLGFALITILISSCAIRKNFLLSSVVPAARGTVKVSKDRNKNYVIDVKVRDLAEVERLAGKNSTYVVWMDTEDDTRNLGQMKSSRGGFSKALKASLKTKTPYKPKRVFITAEESPNVQYPVAQVVLSTEKF
jgi:ribosomal protein S9